MDRFIWGNELFDEVPRKKHQTSFKINERKVFCEPCSQEEMEDAYSYLFAQLHQEQSALDSKISQGELIKFDNPATDCTYLVKITTLRGKFFRKFGFTLSDGSNVLYPEEAYYLSECGNLQVYDGGLPLSLQQLCNTLFRNTSDFSNYLAYVRLTRQGFVVRRRNKFSDSKFSSRNICPQSKVLTFPIDSSSYEMDLNSGQETNSDEFIIASPKSTFFSEFPKISAPGPPSLNEFDVEKYKGLIVFDVYDDRKGNFKKNMSKRIEPTFNLIVFHSIFTDLFPLDQCLRLHFDIKTDAKVVVAIVNDGDVYFMCTNSFSIPTIKRALL